MSKRAVVVAGVALVGALVLVAASQIVLAEETGWYTANSSTDTWNWGTGTDNSSSGWGWGGGGGGGELGPSKSARIGSSQDTYPRSIIGIVKYLTGLENWASPTAGAATGGGTETLTTRYGG